MTDDSQPDDQALRQQMFAAYAAEQLTRERANSDKYDNTILTYSTGALALSLSFIKDVVPLASAHSIETLKASWACLAFSLLMMLVSFHIGQTANRKRVEFAREYYIDKIETSLNKKDWAEKSLSWLNLLAGAAFFVGVLFTTAFVWTNVQEHPTMTDNKITSTSAHAMDGMPSALMQKIPATTVTKGTPSASMHVVQSARPAPTSANASTSAQAPTPKQTK
jgi:hypothetical protein